MLTIVDCKDETFYLCVVESVGYVVVTITRCRSDDMLFIIIAPPSQPHFIFPSVLFRKCFLAPTRELYLHPYTKWRTLS